MDLPLPTCLSYILEYYNLSGSRLPSLKLPSFTSSVGDRAFVSSAPLLKLDMVKYCEILKKTSKLKENK